MHVVSFFQIFLLPYVNLLFVIFILAIKLDKEQMGESLRLNGLVAVKKFTPFL